METVINFILLGSKIIMDGDCIHEIKRHLPLGRKAMTNLESVLKSRDITLLTKICLVKAMVFPVVMYRMNESCTIKKAECRRIDVFKLWCWRRLFKLFFLIYLFFSGRIIALQNFVVFWKPQHESAIDIHISPPVWTSLPSSSPSHPSSLIQSPC